MIGFNGQPAKLPIFKVLPEDTVSVSRGRDEPEHEAKPP
jgi:hypothetical protein